MVASGYELGRYLRVRDGLKAGKHFAHAVHQRSLNPIISIATTDHRLLMPDEPKKTTHDELNWAEINQLHAATIEISKTCFEYKKLCVSLIGIGATLLTKFGTEPFSQINFAVAIMICIGFWIADSTAFYYQRSLRDAMNKKMQAIAKRNDIQDYGTRNLESSKFHALFNESMTLYFALIAVIGFGWVAVATK